MATRLRLPHPSGAGLPSVSPAYHAEWEFTDFAIRSRIGPRRYNTGRTPYSGPHENASGTQDVLAIQYVSDPLTAQTISGTVRGIVPCRESNIATDARAQMIVRVCSNDGTTFRGTILAADTGSLTNELTTAVSPFPNVMFPRGHVNTTLTPLTIQSGDRLVIEIGTRSHAAGDSTDRTFSYQIGDDVGLADCAEDEVGTTGCAWLEFSADLIWAANYTISTYSADHTALSGSLTSAIANAGNSDICYLSAGTWTFDGNSLGTDTSRTKMLRVRPADGVARENVVIGAGATQAMTDSRWLSFENVTFNNQLKFTNCYRVQAVNARQLNSFQLESGCAKISIEESTIGGESASSLSTSYGILLSLDTQDEACCDMWILNNTFQHLTDRDFIEARYFDHLVVDGNTFSGIVQGDPPNDHNDVFRTFLGGRNLVFRNNVLMNGNGGQGFFVNGGEIHDITVENNTFGTCTGTFRALAIDDAVIRMRIVNNTFHDSASFSSGVSPSAIQVVMFNNAFTTSGAFSRDTGTGINWAYEDYNVFNGTPTGVTPGANSITTAVTVNAASSDDFRLTSGSTGVNFGVASGVGISAPTKDQTGTTRTFPCEAGALEGVV